MTSKNERFAPLFTSAEDLHNNACVNWCHDPLALYATAYKEAAENLVKEVVNSHRNLDTFVYPIVFLYRQYIELRLKEIIREGGKLLDEAGEFPMTHHVHKLWPLAKRIVEKVFENEDGKQDFQFVEHVLAEFSKYDPESFSFRYPIDKKGNNPLLGLTHINVRHLSETINRLAEILEVASDRVSIYRDWKNEMDSPI